MELARESSAPYLFNHAMRSWLFAALIAEGAKPTPDPELLAVSAILHDLGLTDHYAGSERFEVDSANAARSFLKERRVPAHHVQLVWDAIALHTTRSIALHKEPEVVITHSGIAVDVIGAGLDLMCFIGRCRDNSPPCCTLLVRHQW
jgi:HD superfamily phosphodiesterase